MRPTVACSSSAGSTTLTVAAPFAATSRAAGQSAAREVRRSNQARARGSTCATLAYATGSTPSGRTHQEGQRDRPAEAPATILRTGAKSGSWATARGEDEPERLVL